MATRVLIVDDSRTMQALIAHALAIAPDIEVVGFAGDAAAAREAIKSLDPDVVTLDVEMPGMSGIDFLEKVMRLRPTPVVMISSQTTASADMTIRALAMGALDCIAKPLPGQPVTFPGLVETIRAASGVRFARPVTAATTETVSDVAKGYESDGRIVAIGSSAGGIEALSVVLSGFPANGPPVVITQHMPATFTRSLASRLDKLCGATVAEAREGDVLRSGVVYVAPGGPAHLEVTGTAQPRCHLREGPSVSGHRPSVDVLFESVAKVAGAKAVGVILTGMGRDGAIGLTAMRRAGARTFGQDEATSFIYGMPRVAFEAGAVERQLPIERIQQAVLAATNRQKSTMPCH